jgi:hypothetical protein
LGHIGEQVEGCVHLSQGEVDKTSGKWIDHWVDPGLHLSRSILVAAC